MSGLRTDERQWLIYDDESMGAVVRGLEAMALSMTGQSLAKMKLPALRAMGNFMMRIASTRLREMMENDGAQRVVVQHLAQVMNWIAGRTPPPDPKVLDELYATVFQLDHRAQAAGVRGPGVHRAAVRGD